MNLKGSLHDVLNRDMSRREFLAYVGAAALAIVGITRIIKAISEVGQKPSGRKAASYGGSRKARELALQTKQYRG